MDETQKLAEELAKISKQSGVPVHRFKAALGFSLAESSTMTLDEARKAFNQAKKGSEEEQIAYLALMRLIQTGIFNTSNIKEVSILWQKAPGAGLSKAKKLVVARWISLATSITLLKVVFDKLPPFCEEADLVLLKMWEIHRATATP